MFIVSSNMHRLDTSFSIEEAAKSLIKPWQRALLTAAVASVSLIMGQPGQANTGQKTAHTGKTESRSIKYQEVIPAQAGVEYEIFDRGLTCIHRNSSDTYIFLRDRKTGYIIVINKNNPSLAKVVDEDSKITDIEDAITALADRISGDNCKMQRVIIRS